MLLFDKLEAGLFFLDLELVSLRPFLLKTLRPFALDAANKNITLKILRTFSANFPVTSDCDASGQPPDALPSDRDQYCIRVDPNKMSQVFRNFISNAIKFTPVGGEIVVDVVRTEALVESNSRSRAVKRVEKRKTWFPSYSKKILNTLQPYFEEEGSVVIYFKDNGAGLSQTNAKRLFDEVVQFHANELQGGGGSGFGLKIVKGIVDLHGGKVAVHSAGEGLGSKFWVKLPLIVSQKYSVLYTSKSINKTVNGSRIEPDSPAVREQPHIPVSTVSTIVELPDFSGSASAAQLQNSPVQKTVSPVPLMKRKILLVDDSELNRKLMGHLCRKGGFDCDFSTDGQEAVDVIAANVMKPPEQQYMAVLLDNKMCHIDGPEAAGMMRKLSYTGLIIGITGMTSEEDVNLFLSAGADHVLAKPVDTVKLKSILNLGNKASATSTTL